MQCHQNITTGIRFFTLWHNSERRLYMTLLFRLILPVHIVIIALSIFCFQVFVPCNAQGQERKRTIENIIGNEMPCRNVELKNICWDSYSDLPAKMSNTSQYKNVFSYMRTMSLCDDILMDCLMLEKGGRGYLRIIKNNIVTVSPIIELKYTMKSPQKGLIYWKYSWDSKKMEYIESNNWGLYASCEVIFDEQCMFKYGILMNMYDHISRKNLPVIRTIGE
jgi:hypothetical protein